MKSIKEIAEEIANDAYKVNSNKFTIARAVEKALRDRDERAAKIAQEFDEWIFCTCSECRADARSHAVKTEPSLARIVTAIRDDGMKGSV